jgi:hypothetical protein
MYGFHLWQVLIHLREQEKSPPPHRSRGLQNVQLECHLSIHPPTTSHSPHRAQHGIFGNWDGQHGLQKAVLAQLGAVMAGDWPELGPKYKSSQKLWARW